MDDVLCLDVVESIQDLDSKSSYKASTHSFKVIQFEELVQVDA